MQRVLKNNPTGFTAQDFSAAHDMIMGVGALLQRFKDGVLPAMAEVVHADLNDAKSLMLTPIKRRRGRKMVRLLLAAEILKKRAAEMALIMDIVDPEDAR
jgi:hypothetical protein